MQITEIFIGTVEDLRYRSRLSAPEYDVVQASGLIRRLLIDGTALVPGVIKELDLPQPRYEWASIYQGAVAGAMLDATLVRSLSQERLTGPGLKVIHSGALAEFLAYKVTHISIDGGITVKDLVKHFANGEGGVHFGSLREPVPPRLGALLEDPSYAPLLLDTIAAIGRVVCDALAAAVAIAAHPEHYAGFANLDLTNQTQHPPTSP